MNKIGPRPRIYFPSVKDEWKKCVKQRRQQETAEIKIGGDHDLPHLRNPDILIGVNDLTHLVRTISTLDSTSEQEVLA
jgi:hypothetical protein